MSYAEDLHHFPRVKFCFRLGVGEGVNVNFKISIFPGGGCSDPLDTSFPIHPASFRKCITPNKLNDLMYHHVTPQMFKRENTAN